MPRDVLTFALEGDVDLMLFPEAVWKFRDLVQALSEEVAGQTPIVWQIDMLSAGSAVIAVKGQAEAPETVERVVSAYAAIGKAREKQEPIPYSERIQQRAHAITGILDGKVTSIRFETPNEESIVSGRLTAQPPSPILHAFGAIRGRVETLTRRRGLKFILYDAVDDRAVTCYVQAEQSEMIRQVWGQRVTVHGWISRSPYTGHPLSVHNITAIDPLPDADVRAYMSARGAVPWESTFPLPEDAIRKAADG